MSRGCFVYKEKMLRMQTKTTFSRVFYANNTLQAVTHLINTILYLITVGFCCCNKHRCRAVLYMPRIKKEILNED